MNTVVKRCLNCGHECSGNFCSNCGQSTAVEDRVTRRNLGRSILFSFTRLTPGFFNTFIGLIIHPWEVVREYLNGKRVKYSEPVTMVLQLMLYFSALYIIFDLAFDADILGASESSYKVKLFADYPVLNSIISNVLVLRLFMAIIIAVCCYFFYRHHTRRPHNVYEYLVAMIYMQCAFVIYNGILRPIELFLDRNTAYYISAVIGFVLMTITIFKTFTIRPWWKAILRYCLFVFVAFACLTIFIIAITE